MSNHTTSSLNKTLKKDLVELVLVQQAEISKLQAQIENQKQNPVEKSFKKPVENNFGPEFFKRVTKVLKDNKIKKLDDITIKEFVKTLVNLNKKSVKQDIFFALSRYFEDHCYSEHGQLIYDPSETICDSEAQTIVDEIFDPELFAT